MCTPKASKNILSPTNGAATPQARTSIGGIQARTSVSSGVSGMSLKDAIAGGAPKPVSSGTTDTAVLANTGLSLKETVLGSGRSTEAVKPSTLGEAISLGVGRSLQPERYGSLQEEYSALSKSLGGKYNMESSTFDIPGVSRDDSGALAMDPISYSTDLVTGSPIPKYAWENSGLSEDEFAKKAIRFLEVQDKLKRSDKDLKQETKTMDIAARDLANANEIKDKAKAKEETQIQAAVSDYAANAFSRTGIRSNRKKKAIDRTPGKIKKKTLIGF